MHCSMHRPLVTEWAGLQPRPQAPPQSAQSTWDSEIPPHQHNQPAPPNQPTLAHCRQMQQEHSKLHKICTLFSMLGETGRGMAGWGRVEQCAVRKDRAGQCSRGAANRRGKAGHGGAQRGAAGRGARPGAAGRSGARRGAAGGVARRGAAGCSAAGRGGARRSAAGAAGGGRFKTQRGAHAPDIWSAPSKQRSAPSRGIGVHRELPRDREARTPSHARSRRRSAARAAFLLGSVDEEVSVPARPWQPRLQPLSPPSQLRGAAALSAASGAPFSHGISEGQDAPCGHQKQATVVFAGAHCRASRPRSQSLTPPWPVELTRGLSQTAAEAGIEWSCIYRRQPAKPSGRQL